MLLSDTHLVEIALRNQLVGFCVTAVFILSCIAITNMGDHTRSMVARVSRTKTAIGVVLAVCSLGFLTLTGLSDNKFVVIIFAVCAGILIGTLVGVMVWHQQGYARDHAD